MIHPANQPIISFTILAMSYNYNKIIRYSCCSNFLKVWKLNNHHHHFLLEYSFSHLGGKGWIIPRRKQDQVHCP